MTQDERPASSTSDHARPIEARNLLLSPNVYPQEQKLCSDVAMLGTILLIVLILILVGALPTWPYSGGWGYYPSGGLGLLLVIVIVLLLMGRI
jgi:hypothetical protein